MAGTNNKVAANPSFWWHIDSTIVANDSENTVPCFVVAQKNLVFLFL